MYHIDDLPFNVKTYCPASFSNLKTKTQGLQVRPLLPTPTEGQLPAGKSPVAQYFKHSKFLP
jgi:hypothetical protein